MNKAELVDLVARQAQISKTLSEQFLNATLKVIQNAVSSGEDVKIVGFGTFDQAQRKARTGRNPKTGAAVAIPASQVPRFRPGKEFKDSLKPN